MKNYTTAFFPDGQIMGKENICSCHKCLNGNLDKCEFEPGRIIKKGADNSEDFDKILIKLIAQSMSRMKLLNSCFFPISKKVHMLPYIHHLKPVNCFIFVKLWVVKPQQHLSLMLTIMLSCKVWNILGLIIWKKLKRKKNLAHYKLLSKKKILFFLSKYFILMYLCKRNSLLTLKIINFYLIISYLTFDS